jgi:hypothetical protein
MKNKTYIDSWASRLGLGLIFSYCLLASVFAAPFAKLHLALPFLPFPIFISEVLLFICLGLFFGLCQNKSLFSRRTAILLGLYFGWVFIKAIINYHYDGPLTCRNAALFYYPAFAVLTYGFCKKARISATVLAFLACVDAVILFLGLMTLYFWCTYVLLLAIALWNAKNPLRWIGVVLLAAVILLKGTYIYTGSRSFLIAVFVSFLFLLFYLGLLFLRRKQTFYLSILVFGFVYFVAGFFIFSDQNKIISLTSYNKFKQHFTVFENNYHRKEQSFVPQPLSVNLYHPIENSPPKVIPKPSSVKVVQQPRSVNPDHPVKNNPPQADVPPLPPLQETKVIPKIQEAPPEVQVPPPQEPIHIDLHLDKIFSESNFFHRENPTGRPLDIDEDNIVFRLFVWRDMAIELWQHPENWLMGFSFGHPQRSKSLEVLSWAEEEWSRDGWITPHNSFFHVVYRGGILGIFLVGALFFSIYRLARDFFIMGSVEGGLLVAALIYWIVLSNFLVILEFPYNAVLFWSLFGITWSYHHQLKGIT